MWMYHVAIAIGIVIVWNWTEFYGAWMLHKQLAKAEKSEYEEIYLFIGQVLANHHQAIVYLCHMRAYLIAIMIYKNMIDHRISFVSSNSYCDKHKNRIDSYATYSVRLWYCRCSIVRTIFHFFGNDLEPISIDECCTISDFLLFGLLVLWLRWYISADKSKITGE